MKKLLMCWSLLAIFAVGVFSVSFLLLDPSTVAQQDSDAIESDSVARTKVSVSPAGSIESPELVSTFRGEIRARRESKLSIRRSGILREVLVHEGDHVRKGEILARLDVSDLQVREQLSDAEVDAAIATATEAVAGPRYQTLNAAAAKVRQLQAKLGSALSRLDRQKRLSKRNAGTHQELDDATFGAAELKATLAAATAELEELNEGTRSEQIDVAKANRRAAIAARKQVDVDRQDSQIVAPYDGRIANRFVDEGEMLSPGQPILKLIEADPLEAHFGIPVKMTAGWRIGDQMTIEVGKRRYRGLVARMQPQVDSITRTRGVDLEITSPTVQTDSSDAIYVGQTATLLVPNRSDAAEVSQADITGENDLSPFWIPTKSLVRGTRGLWSVYVADPEQSDAPNLGSIRRRDVRIVQAAGSLSLVKGLVRRGEFVVTDGAQRIGPGVPVRIELSVPVRIELSVPVGTEFGVPVRTEFGDPVRTAFSDSGRTQHENVGIENPSVSEDSHPAEITE